MSVTPYYILPLLVEQPTWGGEYIAEFKHLSQPEARTIKIGQAFELAGESLVMAQAPHGIPFGIAKATDLKHPTWYGDVGSAEAVSDLIAANPESILGTKGRAVWDQGHKTLIKFTQAKNNSYQVHVTPGSEFKHWQAKPESWYFLEAGQATLGLAPDCDVQAYQARSQAIDNQARQISQKIQAKTLTIEQGRQELITFINQDHPRRFVNTVSIQPHQVIDLSQGGIHHSWEVSDNLPNGNIVYEVQVDVKDENCTLRSFDQGNIKDDGSVRNLTIEDYFTALNTDPTANQSQQYFQTSESIDHQTHHQTQLFSTAYYSMDHLEFDNSGTVDMQLDQSFHHVFVTQGEVTVITPGTSHLVPVGWSLLIPAELTKYRLQVSAGTSILLTYI